MTQERILSPGPRERCIDCGCRMVWSDARIECPAWMCPACTLSRAHRAENERDALAVQVGTMREALARIENPCECHDIIACQLIAQSTLALPPTHAEKIAEARRNLCRLVPPCNHEGDADHIWSADDARSVCKLCAARDELRKVEEA